MTLNGIMAVQFALCRRIR